MIKLTQNVQASILKAAESDDEICGFIVLGKRGQAFYQAKNMAAKPSETFDISADDWIRAENQGEIIAIVHSHPKGEPFLSGADRQIQTRQDLPWILAVNGEIKQFRACPHLRGRAFVYGITDCFSLVRDAYHLAGIEFRDHVRTDIDADAAADSFTKNLPDGGFECVSDGIADLQVGDVILTAMGGHANHAMLYMGDGMVLHHAYNRLSCREPYNRYWQDYTHSVWRHPKWQPNMITAIENDLIHTE